MTVHCPAASAEYTSTRPGLSKLLSSSSPTSATSSCSPLNARARPKRVPVPGAVLTYFSFAPALDPMWPGGEGLLGQQALADRRAHLHLLVDAFWAQLELPRP